MKVLIFWDIYWKIWRKALKKELPDLKKKYNPDFIIASADNISSGRWPTEKQILKMKDLWIDLLTWWDHIFDYENDISNYLEKEDSVLLRPANFFESDFYKIPWKWYKVLSKWWKKLLVIHLMWEVFMRYTMYNAFLKVDEIIKSFEKKDNIDNIIIDFHKETTSEWYWMAKFLDSK